MTDDATGDPYHPSRAQAGPLSGGSPTAPEREPGTPAEAQFPYLATQGIQAPAEPSPVSPESPPRLRNRRPPRGTGPAWVPILFGTIAGLFVLGVLGAYLTWGPGGSPVATRAPDSPDATPHGAVRGYLMALAAGDAEAALGFGMTMPADPTMLTDEVLGRLMAETPITAIEVADADLGAGFQRVRASYLLGKQLVTTEFNTYRRDQVWRLETTAAQADLSALPLGQVPITLNGVALASTTPALFPGHYKLATSAPRFTIAEPAFIVESPASPPGVSAQLQLSEAGREEVITAAEDKLVACLKQRKLAPEGCGFSITSPQGTKLKPSTMRWSAGSGDAFDDLEVSLDHPGSATAPVRVDIHGKVRGADDSVWQVRVLLNRVRADLSGEDVSVQFGQ